MWKFIRFSPDGKFYIPPDELNRAPDKDLHFRYPYQHGSNIPDPEFGKKGRDGKFVHPAVELGPHGATLGMRFYTGGMFPQSYHNQIFIVEHGSWNRAQKIGCRLILVCVEGTEAGSYETFAESWKEGEEAWGRPVDVCVMPDGALLVSNDYAGAIY